MEKLSQETVNFTEKNIDRIASLFPSAITETKDADGKLKRAVNFDQLKQLLSDEVVDGDECYEFTWVGKKQSIIEGNRPIRKTLRPCKEESKNWDTTENLYIEGDNLDVLKLLQNSYLNKVKMIYIDPPYNTGNDFIYRDNFKVSKEDYEEEMGLFDEEENRLFKNTETNGRYHSNWCSMMYPRLQLARNLLTDDGVIFISIDDNEVHNLRKICDEVFGEENFIEALKWKRKKQPSFLAKHTAKVMEYIIIYSKSFDFLEKLSIEGTSDSTKKIINISNQESLRKFKKGVRVKIGDKGIIPAGRYKIKTMEVEYLQDVNYKDGRTVNDVEVVSKFSESQNNISFFIDNDLLFITAQMGLRRDVSVEEIGKRKSITDLLLEGWGDNQESDTEQNEMFGNKFFDYTKPLALIRNLVKSNYTEENIILDFFSGSATTAQAVMQLNAEYGGNRKFIMVQLPEETDPKSEAYKAEYKNICEIGKERIRRAGKKIEEELNAKSKEGELFKDEEHKTPDTGFRVLKVDSTNMKDVYYSPSQYNQQMLLELESNIKDDRTDIDLLYGVLLDWGVPLSLPHITEKIGGKDVHFVNDTDLVACFEEHVPEEVIREIARRKPLRVVFRDSSFRNSPDKINVTEIFKTLSPETTIKVI
ncbi:MAG TPA: site-specific DNA-methyltransferase [Prolixibacteraceae bacterium]|nr:site-specific DNA-methyltransferase [Prolixibacteraceae bacterium]